MTPLSLEGVRECFAKALETQRGLRVTCESPEAATALRHRMNKFRAKDREDSKEIYPPDHPSYGVSEYEKISIVKLENVLELRVSSIENMKVEEL